MRETPEQLLEQLAVRVRACTDCPLHKTRTHAVPGEGPLAAQVVFVGEAPGKDEDEQGRPFVGRSGQLLRETIREVGWREDEVFIGNVLKCRPPGNRDPQESEIEACSHYLQAQIALIRPHVVVTLGRFSLNLLISPDFKITKVRGQHIRKDGQWYVPTLHPSAVLRNRNQLPDFKHDIKKARFICDKLEAGGTL